MNRSIRRTTGLAAMALTLSVSLAACSDSSDSEDTSTAPDTSMEETEPTATPDTMLGAFGPGCSAIPSDGAGSLDGMATEPVATAASSNPLLTTLVAAVTEAGLVDTLNAADSLTVFAPTDDAFAQIPEEDLNALLADTEMLTTVLTHHVVEGELEPDEIVGELTTLAGDTVTVAGSGEEFTVGDENAAVLCGNVPTANAKVYVIDTVLMP